MSRRRYTDDLVSQISKMGGDQVSFNSNVGSPYPDDSEVCIVSNTLLAEAITTRIETEKAWTDKLRYLDEFEILNAVFKYVDVENLKACRLVCKVWNVEACTALRASSYVRLFENLPREMDNFRKLVLDLNHLGTPSPFERYHFSSSQLRSENMDLILFDNKSYIENFYVNESPQTYKSDFQRHMYQILMKNTPHLKVFHCALAEGISFSLVNAHSRPKLYLPALTEFGYWEKDFVPKAGSINFIMEVLHGAPHLKSFHPKILNEKTFAQILRRADLKGLEKLELQSINAGHSSLLHLLLKFRMPGLKVLNLQFSRKIERDSRVSSELLGQIVENYAQTLEELSICWLSNTPDHAFPKCPKLKHLTIDDWTGSLGVFDMTTVPELKSIHKIYNTEFPYDAIISPHPRVENFTLEDRAQHSNYSPQMDFLQSVEEEYTYYFEYIFVQYPNLQCLDITLPMSNALITSIIRIFPDLKALAIENTFSCFSLSEHVFTGLNKYTLQQHLELHDDLLFERGICPRMTCLVQMKKLEKLVLARYSRDGLPTHMMITNAAVKYGLARMEKLEFLQINWNPDLSTDVFCSSLAHVPKIIITDAYRFQPFKVLNTLKTLMPQVEFQ